MELKIKEIEVLYKYWKGFSYLTLPYDKNFGAVFRSFIMRFKLQNQSESFLCYVTISKVFLSNHYHPIELTLKDITQQRILANLDKLWHLFQEFWQMVCILMKLDWFRKSYQISYLQTELLESSVIVAHVLNPKLSTRQTLKTSMENLEPGSGLTIIG